MKLKKIAFLAFLAVFALSMPIQGFGEDLAAEMPETIFIETWSLDWPHWVRADVAWTDGEYDSKLLQPHVVRQLERALGDSSEAGCVEFVPPEIFQAPAPPDDLAALVHGVARISVVKVTGLAPGWVGASPGTLLRVRSLEDLKGNLGTLPHYLFVQAGTFTTAGREICVQSGSGLPEIGETLIIASQSRPEDDDNFLHVQPEGVIRFQSREGRRLVVPRAGNLKFESWTEDDLKQRLFLLIGREAD